MKHCEMESHCVVVFAEQGIGHLSVSFISKTRKRIFSFSDFSVPSEVHHQLKLLFCGAGKIFILCMFVCVCETKPYRHMSSLCKCLLVSTELIQPGLFSPYFWQPFRELSCFHAAQLMMGCGARTHQQCKQRVLPGPCCASSASSVCWDVCMPFSSVSEVLQKALPWQGWSLLAEMWKV